MIVDSPSAITSSTATEYLPTENTLPIKSFIELQFASPTGTGAPAARSSGTGPLLELVSNRLNMLFIVTSLAITSRYAQWCKTKMEKQPKLALVSLIHDV